MAETRKALDPEAFLAKVGTGKTVIHHRNKQIIFAQGDLANAVFYVQKGRVKLTVVSKSGREGVIGIIGARAFFGEGCLAGQAVRMASASAMTDCSLVRIQRKAISCLLYAEPDFSGKRPAKTVLT